MKHILNVVISCFSEPKRKILRIVLLGRTGAGKSTSANTILDDANAFKAECAPNAVTRTCQKKSKEVAGYNMEVIDTPGLFDTSIPAEETEEAIKTCIKVSVPGPHAFLLVVRLGRFTMEESNAVEWIQKNFGEKASDFTILLFTGGDQLRRKSIDTFIEESEKLKKVMDSCKGGYHVFENERGEDRQKQVQTLVEKIEEMLKKNGEKYYTNEMYKAAQKKIKEEEKKRKEEEKRRQKEHDDKIREDERQKLRNRGCFSTLKDAGLGAAAGVGVGGTGAVVTACVAEAAVAAVACPALLAGGVALGFAAGLAHYAKKH